MKDSQFKLQERKLQCEYKIAYKFFAFIFLIICLSAYCVPQGFTEVYQGVLIGVNFSSVAWGDYDNDGDLDILLTGSDANNVPYTKIYRNDGGVFTDIGINLPAVTGGSVAWGDYDNDGDLDILLTGSDANNVPATVQISKIYHNDGGVFTDIGADLTAVRYSSVAWGDYNNDGQLDILLTGIDPNNNRISKIYRNDGGIFTDIKAGLTGVAYNSVAWGDYDNDGDLDILLTGLDPSNNPVSKIYRNDGGVFTDIGAGLIGLSHGSVAWGDYDNDGDLDILLTGTENPSDCVSKIYRNDGGAFTDIGAGLIGVQQGSVAWGDYDNDGDLDILLTGNSGMGGYVSKIYRNDGGVFTDIGADLTGVQLSSVAWGDYDNDGDLDILMTGSINGIYATISKIYRNDGNVFNTIPTAPTGLNASVSGSTATLTWNRATDTETPQNGLTYNLCIGTSSSGINTLSPMANVSTGYRLVVRIGNTNQVSSYQVKKLSPGTYYWCVQAIDNAFAGSLFTVGTPFTINATGVSNTQTLPTYFELAQCYPNPFNPSTTIQYIVPHTEIVTLKIYDLHSREIISLVNDRRATGIYNVEWNATGLASGIYFYRMQAGNFIETKKMILLK